MSQQSRKVNQRSLSLNRVFAGLFLMKLKKEKAITNTNKVVALKKRLVSTGRIFPKNTSHK